MMWLFFGYGWSIRADTVPVAAAVDERAIVYVSTPYIPANAA